MLEITARHHLYQFHARDMTDSEKKVCQDYGTFVAERPRPEDTAVNTSASNCCGKLSLCVDRVHQTIRRTHGVISPSDSEEDSLKMRVFLSFMGTSIDLECNNYNHLINGMINKNHEIMVSSTTRQIFLRPPHIFEKFVWIDL